MKKLRFLYQDFTFWNPYIDFMIFMSWFVLARNLIECERKSRILFNICILNQRFLCSRVELRKLINKFIKTLQLLYQQCKRLYEKFSSFFLFSLKSHKYLTEGSITNHNVQLLLWYYTMCKILQEKLCSKNWGMTY